MAWVQVDVNLCEFEERDLIEELQKRNSANLEDKDVRDLASKVEYALNINDAALYLETSKEYFKKVYGLFV